MSVLPFNRAIGPDQLNALVSTYVETGDLMRAALSAGMPLERACEALQGQGVRSMVQRAMRQTIDVLAAPYALAVLRRAMLSDSERIRVEAARGILDRAGYAAPLPEQNKERGLSELSPDELRALISGLQSELSEHARPVASGPDYMD